MEQKHDLSATNSPVSTSENTGVWIYNTTSRQLDFKNDFFTILGLIRLGMRFASLDELRTIILADDKKAFDEAFNEASSGRKSSVTYRCRQFGGSQVQLESTFVPCDSGVVAYTVNRNKIQ